jgi:hypothetical protein
MRAFVDNMEEGVAALLVEEDVGEHAPDWVGCQVIYLPVEWLPDGTREGTVLAVKMRVDRRATTAEKRRVKRYLKMLGDNP